MQLTAMAVAAHLALAGSPGSQPAGGTQITIAGKYDAATEHLLIPVDFGGSPVWCALDTGFSALIEMDYQRPIVRLIPHQSFSPAPGFVEIPLVFRANPNVPFVRVMLRFADGTEQQTQMVADTGTANYAALVVDPAASRMRPSLGPTADVADTPVGPSGPVKISAARPTAMVVGGVHRSTCDCPARVRLRQGDTIVTVDGKPAADYTRTAMRNTLRAHGETRRLGVRRNGALISIVLQLTKRL